MERGQSVGAENNTLAIGSGADRGSGLWHVEDAAKPKGGALFKGLAVALYGSLEENVQSVLELQLLAFGDVQVIQVEA